MADPGEATQFLCQFSVDTGKSNASKEIEIQFLKFPQNPIEQGLMKELNLCAHDHSFVPPW